MIGTVLTLKQLEALVWVAELGSFRRAAHHLNTTQPNISSRIAGLEAALGVVLMQRDARAITLTDKGRDILAAAHEVLRAAEQIVEIAERPDLVANRLRLGVTELVACTWLHAYLRRIKAAYPALNVELTVDVSRALDAELQARRLDLAIQTAPFATPASRTIPLGDFPYIWVAAPQIARRLTGRHSVADLLPHSVLTHARHTQAYVEFINYINAQGLSASRVVSSNSLASCVQMAADGMGVTLLPASLVSRELARGDLSRIDVDWHPPPLQFAARYQAETAARYLDVVADLAVEAVAEQGGDRSE
ncbi:LysR family transcriptional regulator [Thalassorhabdomicrobium marinisediminis]|uniref:LysR family transcriptional regulator n=1 Tax=Thalassorhabdomicrobium marinisediminis TaxID=2170577 RepID=A0A2T7G0I7_9RHOB|nr:LysR family transcriptional regulator [Thalassorhabdomicrobium marinisediminis]PVA07936.1 LysR family transcriptional regulator [Thalassorhabdomicrobium marinisediminis]